MSRDLVWRENSTFTAWGCSVCDWVIANPGVAEAEKVPAKVMDEFNQHECAKFPRNRPARG